MLLGLECLEEYFGPREFTQKGPRLDFLNGKNMNFGIWIDESSLINKVNPHKGNYINKNAKVSVFIDETKNEVYIISKAVYLKKLLIN